MCKDRPSATADRCSKMLCRPLYWSRPLIPHMTITEGHYIWTRLLRACLYRTKLAQSQRDACLVCRFHMIVDASFLTFLQSRTSVNNEASDPRVAGGGREFQKGRPDDTQQQRHTKPKRWANAPTIRAKVVNDSNRQHS